MATAPPAPLVDGQQRLTVYVDRTLLEVFASDGLTYVPLPFIPKPEDQSVSVDVKGGDAQNVVLELYKLKSKLGPEQPMKSRSRRAAADIDGRCSDG